MTELEARVVLGLDEDDPIDMAILKSSLAWLEDRLTRCTKHEKPRRRKEVKAIQKLLDIYG